MDAQTVHSQFGEDGLVAAVLEKIGITNRWCFEVGAGDGAHLSNTLRLRKCGWSAVLIEADSKHMAALRAHESPKVRVVHAAIGDAAPLDVILDWAGAPTDLDFGCIDIDGQDYWAWHDMEWFQPRIMCVEFSPYQEPTAEIARGAPSILCKGGGQAGREPIIRLGEEKGYTVLAETFCNLLFARTDQL
jgi:hypothetical protein